MEFFFLAPVVFFLTAVGLWQVEQGQIQWVMISGFSLWVYEVANGPPVASKWAIVVGLFIREVGSVQRLPGDDSISVPT